MRDPGAVVFLLLPFLLGVVRSESSYDVIRNHRQAQKAVRDRWIHTPEWLCATPKLHGHVAKKALGSQCVGHPRNYLKNAQERYIFDGLPIFSSCQQHISHKYKFIYVRQPKSSSTAMLDTIKKTFCADSSKCTPDELVQEADIPDNVWASYFVFTVVRNPFTRVASAFDMFNKAFLFQRQGPLGHDVGPHCQLGLLHFSRSVNSMKLICQERGCCPYIGPPFNMWAPGFINQHINDQYHCVFSMGGALMVDYIGISEKVEEDWAQILEVINRRTGNSFKVLRIGNPNGVGSAAAGGVEHYCSSSKLRAFYNETTLFGIALQYASDLHAFGYAVNNNVAAPATQDVRR